MDDRPHLARWHREARQRADQPRVGRREHQRQQREPVTDGARRDEGGRRARSQRVARAGRVAPHPRFLRHRAERVVIAKPGVAGEIALGARRPVVRDVPLSREDPVLHGAHAARDERGLAGPEEPHRHVGLAAGEIARAVVAVELEIHAGVLASEVEERRDEHEGREPIARREAHRALDPRVRAEEIALGGEHLGLDALRPRSQAYSRVRCGQARAPALEEARAEGELERGEATTHGGRVDVERPRRARVAAAALDGEEEAKIVPDQHPCILACRCCFDLQFRRAIPGSIFTGMKAIAFADRIDLDALTLVERPMPEVGPRDLLLRMRAASLNYRDLAIARRAYGTFGAPLIPLSDGVGEIVAVGAEVERFAVGDRVCPTYLPDWIAGEPTEETARRRLGGPLDGVLAEYVRVAEHAAVRAPSHLTDVEAATLPIAGVTAWHALFVAGGVHPGDTVVVQGTGGVSLFALTLARLAGARVIVTSSSPEKLARARELGAAEGIDYRATPDWHARVLDLTEGRGADHVIDVAGGDGLGRSIAAARVGGTVSLVGFVAGTSASLDLGATLRRVVRLQAISVGSRQSFEALTSALALHGARPIVDRVFGFEETRAAYDYLARGGHFGKVAIAFP